MLVIGGLLQPGDSGQTPGTILIATSTLHESTFPAWWEDVFCLLFAFFSNIRPRLEKKREEFLRLSGISGNIKTNVQSNYDCLMRFWTRTNYDCLMRFWTRTNYNGGLLIAKNRDSLATYESLAVKSAVGKNTYLGLFYNSSSQTPYPFLAAGINEHGVSVVQNEAASIYNADTFNNTDQSAVIYTIMENYSSVAEVLADKETLFGNGLANFLIIGDKTEAILVEVGPSKNSFQILNASNNDNRVFHTNHYVLSEMRNLNKIYYSDSEDRFVAIKSLMNNAPAQFTADGSYFNWISNAQDGLLRSIFREMTVASWIASVPETGTPEVLIRFTSPSLEFQRYSIQLTPEFWNSPPASISPIPLSTQGLNPEPIGSELRYTYTGSEL
ncbi:carcinine hydrolase/isopenicillin-N N-acyltransferase family protein [Endozoicomonas sp. SCSIO W0465]|uniref:carcinine hydrolase/isopenicillin-N N-acyltransferase family protein n=1 Tax=Endozoicomonas sp. SCSIO W0465 TaxID=2918516 RepID=UPI0020757782|nr:carcinine hydrolase/isopenicillin-N N-acyltransferase family protein [Endozoicomonas sp. SCSIO W0465]USE37675.1 C45 family peptidase [Endozoicomonas sp. SCSIO W0465]